MELRRTATPVCCHQAPNAPSGQALGSFAIHGFSRTKMIAARSVTSPTSIQPTSYTNFSKNPATGVHLKIAVLEAIANSSENAGLNAILRAMVLEKHDNTWLRSTALRAFARSVQNDWTSLEALDCELTQATDDLAAPEVRVELLCLTP